ncbi:unnamed protein product [Lampetra planeri]
MRSLSHVLVERWRTDAVPHSISWLASAAITRGLCAAARAMGVERDDWARAGGTLSPIVSEQRVCSQRLVMMLPPPLLQQ